MVDDARCIFDAWGIYHAIAFKTSINGVMVPEPICDIAARLGDEVVYWPWVTCLRCIYWYYEPWKASY